MEVENLELKDLIQILAKSQLSTSTLIELCNSNKTWNEKFCSKPEFWGKIYLYYYSFPSKLTFDSSKEINWKQMFYQNEKKTLSLLLRDDEFIDSTFKIQVLTYDIYSLFQGQLFKIAYKTFSHGQYFYLEPSGLNKELIADDVRNFYVMGNDNIFLIDFQKRFFFYSLAEDIRIPLTDSSLEVEQIYVFKDKIFIITSFFQVYYTILPSNFFSNMKSKTSEESLKWEKISYFGNRHIYKICNVDAYFFFLDTLSQIHITHYYEGKMTPFPLPDEVSFDFIKRFEIVNDYMYLINGNDSLYIYKLKYGRYGPPKLKMELIMKIEKVTELNAYDMNNMKFLLFKRKTKWVHHLHSIRLEVNNNIDNILAGNLTSVESITVDDLNISLVTARI
jgi:hypothetical protein